jgi:hypothetical protein
MRSERALFAAFSLWFVAVTVTGFWKSFFVRTLPEPLLPYQIVHGVLYSCWVAVYFLQSTFIATGRRRWHVALGYAAVMLLVLMVPAGFHVVLVNVAAGVKTVDEAGFNLTELTLGLSLAAVGLMNRGKPAIHKRLMMCATLMLTVAATDRAAAVVGLHDVRVFRKTLALAPALALVAHDARYSRRTLPLSLVLLALASLVLWFIISDVLFLRPVGAVIVERLVRVFFW